jgi:hypothetical protein
MHHRLALDDSRCIAKFFDAFLNICARAHHDECSAPLHLGLVVAYGAQTRKECSVLNDDKLVRLETKRRGCLSHCMHNRVDIHRLVIRAKVLDGAAPLEVGQKRHDET